MNNLIEERNQRTRKRKKIKRDMDRIIGLSASDKDKNFMKLSVSSAEIVFALSLISCMLSMMPPYPVMSETFSRLILPNLPPLKSSVIVNAILSTSGSPPFLRHAFFAQIS